jgi:hypothetical protein
MAARSEESGGTGRFTYPVPIVVDPVPEEDAWEDLVRVGTDGRSIEVSDEFAGLVHVEQSWLHNCKQADEDGEEIEEPGPQPIVAIHLEAVEDSPWALATGILEVSWFWWGDGRYWKREIMTVHDDEDVHGGDWT